MLRVAAAVTGLVLLADHEKPASSAACALGCSVIDSALRRTHEKFDYNRTRATAIVKKAARSHCQERLPRWFGLSAVALPVRALGAGQAHTANAIAPRHGSLVGTGARIGD
jgi:hypothetical protein